MIRVMSATAFRRTLAFFAATRKVRAAARRNRAHSDPEWQLSADALAVFANLSLRERLNDRLADAMIAIDEAVQMCELEGNTTDQAPGLAIQIIAAYEHVNSIMKTISD